VLVCFIATSLRAQTTQPTTGPARTLLGDVQSTYSDLKSLELSGTLTFELDAASEKQSQQVKFTASFRAPAHFRHDMSGDLLITSDGRKTYVYKTDQKRYLTADAPAERVDSPGDLNSTVRMALQQQNPSLLAAL